MGARGEVVQGDAAGQSLPAAAAWLLGYVRTDAPGYREIKEGNGNLAVVASGEYRFDAYITAINAAMSQSTWTVRSDGVVIGDGYSLEFTDRLGWVCGFGLDAGGTVDDDAAVAPSGLSRHIPPAGIPLMGATWTRVESEADRRVIFDRHRRNQGYMWGAALVWRCRLTMHRWALEALQTGWCLRGKVTLGCADMLDTPVSVSEPTGAITGYALGLDSVRWLDSIQQTAAVEMSIVTE